jgi:hypothetical protein
MSMVSTGVSFPDAISRWSVSSSVRLMDTTVVLPRRSAGRVPYLLDRDPMPSGDGPRRLPQGGLRTMRAPEFGIRVRASRVTVGQIPAENA